MLNKFTVNYRGVEIIPQIKHLPTNKDVLDYEYNGYHVIVTVDTNIKMYEELIKDCVIRELED